MGAGTVPVFVMTVRAAKNPTHNPRAKVTGACVASPECTDQSGEHHTFVVLSQGGVEAIRAEFARRNRLPGRQ